MELKKLKPSKLNRIAEDLVRTGVKVYRYRVDVLDPSLAKQLSEDTQALDEVRRKRTHPARIWRPPSKNWTQHFARLAVSSTRTEVGAKMWRCSLLVRSS